MINDSIHRKIDTQAQPLLGVIFYGFQAFDCVGIALLLINQSFIVAVDTPLLAYFNSEAGFLFFFGFTVVVLSYLLIKQNSLDLEYE